MPLILSTSSVMLVVQVTLFTYEKSLPTNEAPRNYCRLNVG